MHKYEFAADIAELLRSCGVKKKVKLDKYKMHITDDDGNTASFMVTPKDREVSYTKEDVRNIIDAQIFLMEKYMREGKSLTYNGIWTLYPKKKNAMRGRNFKGEEIIIPERFVPAFKFGNKMKVAAKLYSEEVRNSDENEEEPLYSDEDYEFGDD